MDNNNLNRPPVITAAAASGTAAILVFAMMPVLVGGMADRFDLDDVQSGLVATSYFATYALVALTSPFWIRRWNWRAMVLVGFIIMILSLSLALFASSHGVARLAMAASGLGAGLLYPVSLTLVSDMEDTERAYAIKLAVEQLVPAGLLILLSLGALWLAGLQGALGAILAAVIVCLLACAAMPARGQHTAQVSEEGAVSLLTGLLALLALAVNFSGFAGLWVFMERIAAERGFDSDFINLWLAVGLITSGVGPLLAAALGDRLGCVRPLLLSTVAALASLTLLAGQVSTTAYAAALTLLPLTYYFGISFFFSIVAAADVSGRIVGLMSFALALGSALGPALFGATKAAGGPVLSLMASCMVVGAFLIVVIARRQQAPMGVTVS